MKALFILIFTLLLSSLSLAQTSETSPIGYWKVIDTVTGQPKSIVHIWKMADHTLTGKIIKLFPQAKNQLHQPTVGMVVISGLTLENKQWAKGHMLNPDNGKTYHCNARLSENGKKLNVKEYTGLPLFGRSQTWERVDLMSG